MIPFNLIFCPNALHGMPHVGHFWYALHIRHIRDWITEQNEKYDWGLDIGTRVLFDVHSKPQYEGVFTDMLDWMGFEYDGVDRMADWGGTMQTMALQAIFMTRNWLDSSITYWHFADFDAEGRGAKAMYFKANCVWWHVRGADLFPEKIADKAAQQMYPTGMPTMFYIPLLKTGPMLEDKIGGPNVGEAYLMPRHFSSQPKVVERALMRTLGLRGVAEDCYPGKLQPQHALIGKDLILPPTWYHVVDPRTPGDIDA